MSTPVTRLMVGRTSALSSISCAVASSSTLPLARRSLSSSPVRSEENAKPSRFNLWSMLTRGGSTDQAAKPPPSSPSINTTSPGQSPYDKLPSVHANDSSTASGISPPPPTNPPASSTVTANAGSEGGKDSSDELTQPSSDITATKDDPSQAYSSSAKYYNPAWNVGAFGLNPEPTSTSTPTATAEEPAPTNSTSLTSSSLPTRLPYQSLMPATPIHFAPIPSATPLSRRPQSSPLDGTRLRPGQHRLPRLALSPNSSYGAEHFFTTDLDERWRQLSQEYKLIHHRKVGDQFSGRTLEFAPGKVGMMMGRLVSLIVRNKTRIEEKRKERFEHNPIKDWRLRRERHMRRFAVAMRRNVQIVHGLRLRGQSPAK